jgi:predicted TIM-barrel fold metal-dependent hydrolase
MRVDAHCHVVQEGTMAPGYWDGIARVGAAVLPGVEASMLREMVIPAYFDADGSAQIEAMDLAGVDMAIAFPFDWSGWVRMGAPEVGWREQNAWYRDFAAAYPDRIRWGFCADPRHDGAVAALKEALANEGASMVKIHPSSGFRIDDPVVYPMLEAAGEAGVPVLFHTGPSPTPAHSHFSDPRLLDTVAADFPDLPLVAGHTANLQWRDVLAVAALKPNVYCEISGWQTRYQRNPERFHADVREVLEVVGAHRVMWGTDAPHYRPVVPDDDFVKAFTDAPEGTFTPEETDAILGGTAATLFGLA